jgi:ACS family tartrate transporter-like MFS transporter
MMAASAQAVAVGTGVEGPLQTALRKARWRLLPLLGVCYLVAYMDRVNISFAAESMNRDLHFTAKMYGLGAGLFFLSYALCEIPSNRLLLRFGARRWLARIMLTWGLLAAAMMFVRTPAHFYGARLLLGCAEAGYFPGALYFVSQWFPVTVRARAISLFYVSLPLSSAVMGGLAGALLRLDGRLGLRGWQWMFLLEGAPAVVLAFVVWFGLPDGVQQAKWLSAREREALQTELAKQNVAGGHAEGAFGRVLRNQRVWLLAAAYFMGIGVMYAMYFSQPVVLRQLTGWDAGRAGYIVAATGLAAAAGMLTAGWLSSRSGRRRVYVVGGLTAMALGAAVTGLHYTGWVGVGGVVLISLGWMGMQGPMMSVISSAMPGEAAAVAIAFINMCGLCGGFVGPYWMGWMHERTAGYAAGMGWLCVPCALAAVVFARLLRHERMAGVAPALDPAMEEEEGGIGGEPGLVEGV